MAFVKPFILSLVLFLVLDFIWLGYVMKAFNLNQLSEIGRIQDGNFAVLYWPALLVYIFMSLFLVVFILPKISGNESLLNAFFIGAMGGLFVYGIYDMTNMAILNKYPVAFALVDMSWGTVLFGTVSLIVKKFT